MDTSTKKGATMARKRQTVARLTTKSAVRTAGKRILADRVGTGLFGALAKTVFLHGVREMDKRI